MAKDAIAVAKDAIAVAKDARRRARALASCGPAFFSAISAR
jgi:hypothetical protein